MFLAILFFIVFLQLLGYTIMDSKNKPRTNKRWLLFAILLFYFIVFPYILYAIEFAANGKEVKCGLPIIGMIGACWVIGGGITIIAHLSYYVVKKLLANG